MKAQNMNELVTTLLDRKIIVKLNEENHNDDYNWYDKNYEQYAISDYDYMITYTDNDGIVNELEGLVKDGDNWLGAKFDDSMIYKDSMSDLETLHDGKIYSNLCDVRLWHKESV